MRILPPVLRPWADAIERRHAPPMARGRYGYRQYRQCLRWEFGFTCPFCLCHESDLTLFGVEGTGLTHVEHFIPASRDEAGINRYVNCFYICRFCNTSRRDNLVETAQLLEGRLRGAWQDLKRCVVVPRDRKSPCACGSIELCKLPRVLEEQVVDVDRAG